MDITWSLGAGALLLLLAGQSVSGRAGKGCGSCEQSWDKSWYFQDLKGVYKRGRVTFHTGSNARERGVVFKLKEQQSRLDMRES